VSVLTTHAGSLPRPDALLALMQARVRGEAVDERAYAGAVRQAVADVVRKQAELGIDVVDDGEQGKIGFIAYVNERLDGLEPLAEGVVTSFGGSKEHQAFPEFYEWVARTQGGPGGGVPHMACRGPIAYKGAAKLKSDVDNLKAALGAVRTAEAFMPSASPASIESWQKNEYYQTDEEFVWAIADAMREEYKAIVDAGFLVQIDDPFLATYYMRTSDATVEDAIKFGESRVEALNHALRGIPPERIRYHTCYGINMGPRTTDLEMKYIVGVMLKIQAGSYSFEAANPRHEHEWVVWRGAKLPAGKKLIPGVITHSSVLVEHPELVAQRIVRFAEVVGRDNVIAGSDCGFATHPSANPEIHPTIAWAKLQALAEGARLASQQLWR
jgi:5-methyltetrahydropteroyltriglutamate--homocysteine methyltransferase